MSTPIPIGRRGRSGSSGHGVRFAADADDEESVAITLGEPVRTPRAAGDESVGRGSQPSRDAPPETDTEAETGVDMHIGGVQLLSDGISNDVEGNSRAESDADGPLDVPLGVSADAGCGGQAHSGDEGRPEAVLGTSVGSAAGHAARRHHRAAGSKPGKADKKSGKQSVMRTWLRIDKTGETTILQADKWRITHKLGIQTRDLRLLDPNLSTKYPSAILCRDKAIVVNLEHLKAIITTSFVLVVNPEDEKVLRFIDEVKTRLAGPVAGMPPARSYVSLGESKPGPFTTLGLDLPFELKVLECCLDMTAGHLDFITMELEAASYPALDSLANKVSSSNLERVRRYKNTLVRLTKRVETVREVLEKFLDDDGDMHALNLTAKELHEEEEQRQLEQANNIDAHSTASTGGSRSSGSSSSASSDSSEEEAETAVVEMLLETYFMHLDNTYNKLQTLHEYIGDTEDLVNIKLDQHRNQLITIDLILTAGSTCLAMMTVVGAWFGMNLNSDLQETPHVFTEVTVITSLGGVLLLMLFVYWLWRSKLIMY